MHCKNCENEIEDNKICSKCGSDQENPIREDTEPNGKTNEQLSEQATDAFMDYLPYEFDMKKKPVYKKWWFWLIIVLLILGMLGAILSGERNEPPPTEPPPIEEAVD